MHRTAAAFATALVLAFRLMPAFAAEHEDVKVETEVKKGDDKKNETPPEKAVTTSHSVGVGGKSIAYKATAGTLIIRDEKGKPDASVFYVAYTADGDSAKRPVTFLYNGGPGSSSIWLHMGSFGPVRVVTESPEATAPAPFHVVPNDDSLLDKTDLVFIDAIGTGFSKGLPKGKDENGKPDKDDDNPNKRFWGTDQDIDAFGRFMIRYVTVNKRWNSPKFLFGESYGTPRSAGLARYLEEHGVALNGVVLLSSIINYASRLPGTRQRLREPAADIRGDRLVSQQTAEQTGDAGTVPHRSAQFRARRLRGRVEQRAGPHARRARCDRRAHIEIHRPERRVSEGSESAREPAALIARS